jgi:NitT/TauT family transport system substrate-binding protein
MSRRRLVLAVPDMVSNSYFPILAAAHLGLFAREGLDVSLELLSPTDTAFSALRDGSVDLVGAEAHAALGVFRNWKGVKLLCAQSQGMYWFLVMRKDLDISRGDIDAVRGRRIAAAPWVVLALRQLLRDSGIDPDRDVEIAAQPELLGKSVNTGVTVAQALEDGRIDGFWANGMGAEKAVQRGVGTIVLDVRRGDGPQGCFDYTLPIVATTDDLVTKEPKTAISVVRAIVGAQRALVRDVTLATEVGTRYFPPLEASLIETLVTRDLPFYDASLSAETISSLNRFSVNVDLLDHGVAYEDVVASIAVPHWSAP